ncbi:hypothetical protein [Spongiimicrobium sp. 3-5]
MEKSYPENVETCELVKASPETVQFLLNYSKSLKIVDYEGMKFESNIN